MGWDTQIIIIVEHIVNEEVEIAKDLFNSDANSYYKNGISFIKYRECDSGNKILFFTYERRKYLPYWTVQEVSKKFRDKYFTIIASCPDYLCGPAGLVKIYNGDIIDSYGFTERVDNMEETIRILENPKPELLFQFFGKNKVEELLRERYVEKQPKKWIEEIYDGNILDYNDDEKEKFKSLANMNIDEFAKWKEIKQPATSYWQ